MSEVILLQIREPADLQAAFALRKRVFVEEQAVPEELELDVLDHHPQTLHILARGQDGQPIGTARMRPYQGSEVAKVERVAVLPAFRGRGVGVAMMGFLEREAARLGFRELALHAQIHAQGFYERLGYQSHGERFEEAGIGHLAMRKALE